MTPTPNLLELIEHLRPIATNKPLIRLGPSGDGGYLLPDDMEDLVACFSPGVSTESGFEGDCAERGMEVYLADFSVDHPAAQHKNFHFTKKYIAAVDTEEAMSFQTWIEGIRLPKSGDLLLQMDVEGYEYEVLLNLSPDLLKRFRIVVLEVHNLEHLWARPFFDLASRVFDRILLNHTCVHLHPNNLRGVCQYNGISIPRMMEFTFLRNDRIYNREYRNDFPHPLDADNTSMPHIPLPKDWQGEPGKRPSPLSTRPLRKII
jgi:hypothetical protein